MKRLFYAAVAALCLASCSTANKGSNAYLDKYMREYFSPNCVNIYSNVYYNEYKDTVTNNVFIVSADRYGKVDISLK